MAQPKMARLACPQCNANYKSDHELQNHMQTAHRWAASEPKMQSFVAKPLQEPVKD